MKIGVIGNQVVCHMPSGFSAYSGKTNTPQERLDMAHELIGAARLLIQQDFPTTEAVVEKLQDMAEEA